MEKAFAVILAGGSGERFWPLSTQVRPKQFLSVFQGRPLLSLAVDRLRGLIPPERVFIITADRLVAATQAAAIGVPKENIVGEPCRRDTAAAVAVACGIVRQRDPDGIVCILTADHLMADVDTFRQTLKDAVTVSGQESAIVTIGIKPTHPATGFGYIEEDEVLETNTRTHFVRAKRFVEKPDLETARKYLSSGKYLWNAGMFIWQVPVMMAAFQNYAPDLAKLAKAVSEVDGREALSALLAEMYPQLRSISIDYAVMEHVKNIVMARGVFGWDDVGSWPAIAEHFPADEAGNVVIGNCESLDSERNIIVSEDRLTAVIGLRDLIVVQSKDVTLICHKSRAQEVKKLLKKVVAREDGERYI